MTLNVSFWEKVLIEFENKPNQYLIQFFSRDYKYFNDVYAFNLDTYTWVQIVANGNAPFPRSGCMMAGLQDLGRVMIYGGYSKERVKKDVDVGKIHTDMTMLMPEGLYCINLY